MSDYKESELEADLAALEKRREAYRTVMTLTELQKIRNREGLKRARQAAHKQEETE